MTPPEEEVLDLADGGKFIFIKDFLAPDEAQRYFTELRDTAPWEQKKAAYGQLQPRLTASYGDEGVDYHYSGTVNIAIPWTETILAVKKKIEAILPRLHQATNFNHCLLNRYRDGMDSVGMHADNEPGVGNVIGTLSLGATRTFRIRHNKSKEEMRFAASNGSLIIMGGTMQQFWKHAVEKELAVKEERISLTFRRIEGG